MTATRKAPASPEEQLAIGKRLHEKEWPSMGAAEAALGVKQHNLFAWLAKYRRTIGFVSARATSASKSATKRHAKAKRTAARAAAKAAPAPEVISAPIAPQIEVESPEERKRRLDRERHAEKRAARREARANGYAAPPPANRQLVRMEAPLDAQLANLAQRNAELERMLTLALEEANTLKKLLMAVGTTI